MIPIMIKKAGMARVAAKRLFKVLPKGVRRALGEPSNLQKVMIAAEKGNQGAKQWMTRWVQDFTGSPESVRRGIMQDAATTLQQTKSVEDTKALKAMYANLYKMTSPPTKGY